MSSTVHFPALAESCHLNLAASCPKQMADYPDGVLVPAGYHASHTATTIEQGGCTVCSESRGIDGGPHQIQNTLEPPPDTIAEYAFL